MFRLPGFTFLFLGTGYLYQIKDADFEKPETFLVASGFNYAMLYNLAWITSFTTLYQVEKLRTMIMLTSALPREEMKDYRKSWDSLDSRIKTRKHTGFAPWYAFMFLLWGSYSYAITEGAPFAWAALVPGIVCAYPF